MVLWLHFSAPYIVSINTLWQGFRICIMFIWLDADLSLGNNDMQSHFKINPYNYKIFQGRNFTTVYLARVNNALQNPSVKFLWKTEECEVKDPTKAFTLLTFLLQECHKLLIQNKSSLWHHQSEDTTHNTMGFKCVYFDRWPHYFEAYGSLTLVMLLGTPLHVGCWLFQMGSDGRFLTLKLCSVPRNVLFIKK